MILIIKLELIINAKGGTSMFVNPKGVFFVLFMIVETLSRGPILQVLCHIWPIHVESIL
jgi:hypothetical protein